MKYCIPATAYLFGEIGADRLLETLKVCVNYQSTAGHSAALYDDCFPRERQRPAVVTRDCFHSRGLAIVCHVKTIDLTKLSRCRFFLGCLGLNCASWPICIVSEVRSFRKQVTTGRQSKLHMEFSISGAAVLALVENGKCIEDVITDGNSGNWRKL